MINADHWHDVDSQEWPWPNFTPSEMACRGTGVLIVSRRFMDDLQSLRTELGAAMNITSGCRSTDHNKRSGGKSRSLHICDDDLGRGQKGCLAVDVACNGATRGHLFSLAWTSGWAVGWNGPKGFLHLDKRMTVGWAQTTFEY